MKWRTCSLIAALVAVTTITMPARADEFRLKDGSKIVGTIVGFEDGAFKVETSYGFALVRKNSIAEIIPGPPTSSATKAPEPKPTDTPASDKDKPTGANSQLGNVSNSVPNAVPNAPPAAAPSTAAVAAATAPLAAPAGPKPTAAKSKPAPAAPAAMPPPTFVPVAAPVPAPSAPPVPPPPPKPAPMQESVRGNLYVNQTYGFQMYRAPGWDLIGDARKSLPNAVAALGTADESTLIVVGHDVLTGSLESHAAASERTFRAIYENYRPVSSTHTTVAGMPAIETHFRGGADGHDWSVVAVTLARGGKEIFTILAMTYADSDLIQIQENVIAKAIASLQFTGAQ